MDGNGMYIDKTIPGNAGGAYAPLGRIDKFELLRELGEGGFGAVYLARDTVAGIDVAIKGLPPEVKHNRAEIENIRENFALVKRFRHPNIVAVTDLHCAQDVFYAGKDVEDRLRVYERDTMVVMDYAPGVTLSNWRKQFPGKTVPPGAALEIVRQIAAALDYAHGRKVLHRDIKPANIMVETADDGTVAARVLDFGLAAEIRSSMGRVSREIRDTSGSRPYMAPEQWGGKRQGPATDQYALAVLLYELVTGEVPFASVFDCGDAKVMRLAVMEDAPEIPSGLPKAMCKALAVALSKKPEDRFASCGDFVAALEGRKTKVPRGGAEPRSGGGRASLVAAAFAALALAGGVLWLGTARDPVEPEPTTRNAPYNQPPSAPPAPAPEPAKPAPEPAKPATSALDGSAASRSEDETVRKRAAEFYRLKTLLNITTNEANAKIERIGAFRNVSDGFESRIKSADGEWTKISNLPPPGSLEEAQTAFEMASNALSRIESALDWLQKNKEGRDAAINAMAEIDKLHDDAKTFNAGEYAAGTFAESKSRLEYAETAFKKSEFVDAGRLFKEARVLLASAVTEARKFKISTIIDSAKEYFAKKHWQECIAECDKVLGWDAGNTEASDLKNKANAQIGPSDGEHRWFTLPGGVKMEMVYVAASRHPFKMGSENGYENEKPVHDVRFTKGFWIGKYPITQSQWKELVSVNGVSFDNGNPSPWFSSTGGGRDRVTGLDTSDFPMENISWNDCDALVRALNRNATDGRTYAMPTEAQWEFAARGGNKSQGYVYSGGNDMDGLGWYYENSGIRRLSDSDWKVENLNSNKCRTHSVREKDIGNELGIVGMSGNVWEWCKDLYDKDYYANSPTDDPCNTASGSNRVLRGGGWDGSARRCRSANRYGNGPGIRYRCYGFRLCCSAGPRD